MQDLIQNIEDWANARNIINGTKPIDQAMKLFSEFGELADNVGKGRDCRDDIGDIFVVLAVIAAQMGGSISQPIFSSNKSLLPSKELKILVCSLGDQLIHLSMVSNQSLLPAYVFSNSIGYLELICDKIDSNLQECVQIALNNIQKEQVNNKD